jgi:hypothetical protein
LGEAANHAAIVAGPGRADIFRQNRALEAGLLAGQTKKEAPARRPEPLKFCVLDVPKNSRGNGLVASKQTQITR